MTGRLVDLTFWPERGEVRIKSDAISEESSLGEFLPAEYRLTPEGVDDRFFEALSTGQKTIKITVAELEARWGSLRGEWGFGADEADDDETIRFRERDADEGIYVPQRIDNFRDWQTVGDQTFTADLELAD